jgi:hypothetical protein
MREKRLSETKKAVIIFHYAEKIKSNLIIATALLEVLDSLKDEDVAGAKKLLVAYYDALIQEVNIAANASGIQGFREVSTRLERAVTQTEQHDYAGALRLVSEAVSITTTSGNQAAETLKEKDLI